jgi:hypothetical protein
LQRSALDKDRQAPKRKGQRVSEYAPSDIEALHKESAAACAAYISFAKKSGKVTVNKIFKTDNRISLVHTVGNDGNSRALYNTERKHTEKALRVNAAIILFNPDRALEAISLLNKEGSRPCVESYTVLDGYVTGNHSISP